MKKPSLDRTFRVIWLIVGALLLLVLLIGGGMVVAQWIGNRGAGEEAVRVARESQPARQEARAVRYGPPEAIAGTTTRLVKVQYGRAYEPEGAYASMGPTATVANVIFLEPGAARLLLERPAFIRDVDAPGPPRPGDPPGDPAATWISYLIALEDTDGDGRLDGRDQLALYVSDLEGRNLRPVLRPPLVHTAHLRMDAGRMLVYALEPPAGQPVSQERWRQRAFVYDVASGQLSPYAALDSAAVRAGQILAR